jgi:hypothetical protein
MKWFGRTSCHEALQSERDLVVRWVRGFGTKAFKTFGHPNKDEDEEEEEDDGFIEDKCRAMVFKH